MTDLSACVKNGPVVLLISFVKSYFWGEGKRKGGGAYEIGFNYSNGIFF